MRPATGDADCFLIASGQFVAAANAAHCLKVCGSNAGNPVCVFHKYLILLTKMSLHACIFAWLAFSLCGNDCAAVQLRRYKPRPIDYCIATNPSEPPCQTTLRSLLATRWRSMAAAMCR